MQAQLGKRLAHGGASHLSKSKQPFKTKQSQQGVKSNNTFQKSRLHNNTGPSNAHTLFYQQIHSLLIRPKTIFDNNKYLGNNNNNTKINPSLSTNKHTTTNQSISPTRLHTQQRASFLTSTPSSTLFPSSKHHQNKNSINSKSTISPQSSKTTNNGNNNNNINTTQRRGIFGIVQNMRHMDWERVKRNWQHFFVWHEEYKLGKYRADQKRMLFHARRTGGLTPPYDPIKGKHIRDHDYLNLLQTERRERFMRVNLWRKAKAVRRWAVSRVLIHAVNIYNFVQDMTTRFIGWFFTTPRGHRFRFRKIFTNFIRYKARWGLYLFIRVFTSFFMRLELTRVWTLKDIDFQMSNRVSGEVLAKWPLPKGYSFSKYVYAFGEPIFNTYNVFHGPILAVRTVIVPLFKRWWLHINDYKPYLGFIKFGILQWALCFALGSYTMFFTRYRWLDGATYSYRADFAHNYIALMTRAVYAEILIAMIEDGLIQVDNLTEGIDYEIHTKLKSQEYKYIDDEIEKRCREVPGYAEQMRAEGIPVTLEEFFGLENIPKPTPQNPSITPKDQVLYILRQYTNYNDITREMLRKLKPLYEVTDKTLRILYSIGVIDEDTVLARAMGPIASPRTILTAYRALLNIIGTRDAECHDPSVTHEALIRAITRKFDLTILPANQSHITNMKKAQRPYQQQFEKIPWDVWALRKKITEYDKFRKKFTNIKKDKVISHNVDLYHGETEDQYNIEKHGEHQHFTQNLPSVTNGGDTETNLKGVGRAFFDPYVATLLPSFHERPLTYELIVLRAIKRDLIQLARIHPEYNEKIPEQYDPYIFRKFIKQLLQFCRPPELDDWEVMVGREPFFESVALTAPEYDFRSIQHAKWLWAQAQVCVYQKVRKEAFVSPMYYIENTCPGVGETNFRSVVDTKDRWVLKDGLNRPLHKHQSRGLDYQMIDPYAKDHYHMIQTYRTNTNYWDYKSRPYLDGRVDNVYRDPLEDMGRWPEGKSVWPFLGINKYPGANPMTNYIGLLCTSTENLITLNRLTRDLMLEQTDEGLTMPKYDPFGQQYYDNAQPQNFPAPLDLSEIEPTKDDKYYLRPHAVTIPLYPPPSTNNNEHDKNNNAKKNTTFVDNNGNITKQQKQNDTFNPYELTALPKEYNKVVSTFYELAEENRHVGGSTNIDNHPLVDPIFALLAEESISTRAQEQHERWLAAQQQTEHQQRNGNVVIENSLTDPDFILQSIKWANEKAEKEKPGEGSKRVFENRNHRELR